MTNRFSVNNLQHQYPSNPFQLGPLDLSFADGTCVGLMGENGAGKSTLFQIVTGNLQASGGEVRLGEHLITHDAFALKKLFGYLPQNLELPQWVSATEILRYASRLYQLEDAEALIAKTIRYWEIDSYKNKPIAACSHGMKKRVALGLATIHNPDLLILDEPFSGLDLYHIKALQDLIAKRRDDQQITVLSTHIAPYSAKLCSRILRLVGGQLSELENWRDMNYLDRITAIEQLFYDKA